jgi:hypothetical protein
MKKILRALIIFGAGYTVAKADDTIKPVTISDVKTTVVEQGYKLKDFVVDEIQATKDYQAEQWAEVKARWAKLKAKFSSE